MEIRKRTRSGVAENAMDTKTHYGIPIYDLIASVDKKRRHEETAGNTNEANGGSTEKPLVTANKPTRKRKKIHASETVLLSEKYRSSAFFDLLGNDDANRQILRWVTYWKSCVFGTPPTLNEETDRLGRPSRKLLLVNGPPGSGKTTAVHVIARQAGFDTLEINASDERGAAVVKDRIAMAVESHQVNSERPTAIVADEVEGAAEHGFVRALTRLLTEDTKALADTGSSTSSNKKRKRKHSLLLRPIIAICNDVWSPNLHNLRQYATIVHFRRHPPNRLIKRLEQICVAENLRFGTRQLAEVASQCDCDLRACLNALQFGARRDAESQGGDSVELTDWTALVKHQFLHQRPATFQQLESCSDIDKLVAACFTAYLDNNYIDDLLKKPASMGDFLAMSDNRFATDEMKALTADSFGRLFRSPGLAARPAAIQLGDGKPFGRPPSHYEENQRTKSIVSSIRANATPLVRASLSDRRALLEVLPFIVKFADPPTQKSVGKEEKAKISTIAQVLKDFGIRLRTERLENGAFAHRLDPPIELTCVFGEAARVAASSGMYISRGQIKEALSDLSSKPLGGPNSHLSSQIVTPGKPDAGKNRAVQAPVVSAKPALDWTSYFIKTPAETATQIQHKADLQAKKVWVQFSEGFSNAVRKPIGWSELLYM